MLAQLIILQQAISLGAVSIDDILELMAQAQRKCFWWMAKCCLFPLQGLSAGQAAMCGMQPSRPCLSTLLPLPAVLGLRVRITLSLLAQQWQTIHLTVPKNAVLPEGVLPSIVLSPSACGTAGGTAAQGALWPIFSRGLQPAGGARGPGGGGGRSAPQGLPFFSLNEQRLALAAGGDGEAVVSDTIVMVYNRHVIEVHCGCASKGSLLLKTAKQFMFEAVKEHSSHGTSTSA